MLRTLPGCPPVIPHELNPSAANMSCRAQRSSALNFVWPRVLVRKYLEISIELLPKAPVQNLVLLPSFSWCPQYALAVTSSLGASLLKTFHHVVPQ